MLAGPGTTRHLQETAPDARVKGTVTPPIVRGVVAGCENEHAANELYSAVVNPLMRRSMT
jgi:hypothetical protein